jgi:type I restriction enzyme S subunit
MCQKNKLKNVRENMLFKDVFIDVTKKATKLKTSEYQKSGKYPVVDQGQKLIAGYTDLEEGLFTDVPAIIFGDHTRVIKYIDTPFFIGADGVKVIKHIDQNIDYKYLYYLLSSVRIPNTGYNRHYKWLKESVLPEHNHSQKAIIVNTLSLIDSLIKKQNEYVLKFDELVKSRFVEMFGDPVSNTLKWHRQQIIELTTKIGSGATPKGGRDSYCSEGISLIRSMNVHNGFFEYKDLAHISDEQAAKLSNVIIQKNDVLLNITGASVARCCVVPDEILPARVNQHVCIIRCNDHVLPVFISKAFTSDSFQKYLLEIAGSGATREAITKQQIEQISMIVPPLLFQNQFAEFVAQVEKQKLSVQKSIDKLEILKKSLMQEYFG